MNILLVEDNESIADGLKFNFEKNGYKLDYCLKIKDAKEYLKNHKPNLIILDLTLPDGNGFELYESVIKEKNIPTIFLTAKDDEETIVKGLEIGGRILYNKTFFYKRTSN